MSEQLRPHEEYISIEERKCMSRCRVDDLDVKANRQWMYEDITCSSCQQNIIETQYHILNCKYLLGKNEALTYIPDYRELYNGEIKEQIYVSRVIKKTTERGSLHYQLNSPCELESTSPCSTGNSYGCKYIYCGYFMQDTMQKAKHTGFVWGK